MAAEAAASPVETAMWNWPPPTPRYSAAAQPAAASRFSSNSPASPRGSPQPATSPQSFSQSNNMKRLLLILILAVSALAGSSQAGVIVIGSLARTSTIRPGDPFEGVVFLKNT